MAAAHKITREHVLVLEDQVLKTPLELLRRSFKASQRNIEKDFAALNVLARKVSNAETGPDGELTPGVRAAKLATGIDRVKGLKRKLADLLPSPSHPAALRPRLEHMSKLDSLASTTDPGFDEWSEKRLIRYIVDYLVRSDRQDEARILAKSRGIEDLVDIDLFLELKRIDQSIEARSCTEALAWCGENRGTLKKMKNTLEFSLRLQEYIELCRARSILPALAYLRKHLASTTGGGWAETHGPEIKRALVLLTVDEDSASTVGAYASLYSPRRWQTLSNRFTSTFQALYSLPPSPLLSTSLAAGLSALKLPHCTPPPLPAALTPSASSDAMDDSTSTFHLPPIFDGPPVSASASNLASLSSLPLPLISHPDSEDSHPRSAHNRSCPTCSAHLGELSNELPSSHQLNSVVVCRISGKVMDDGDQGGGGGAMAFPNGYVYSYGALQEMAEQDEEGKVTCPRSGYRCEFAQLRKVFLS